MSRTLAKKYGFDVTARFADTLIINRRYRVEKRFITLTESGWAWFDEDVTGIWSGQPTHTPPCAFFATRGQCFEHLAAHIASVTP